MEVDWGIFAEQFARTFALWWVILPAIVLGLIVGAIPGFSAANTIIILLPLTLSMTPEIGLTFMVALYASSRMGAGIPAILVNIPGTAGAAATPFPSIRGEIAPARAALAIGRRGLEPSLVPRKSLLHSGTGWYVSRASGMGRALLPRRADVPGTAHHMRHPQQSQGAN